MELKILPSDIKRYIITEFIEYEITDDNPYHILKSLFGRFEGEKSYFLVFRHLFTRIDKSKFFLFKKNDLYPKDVYSLEFRIVSSQSDDSSFSAFRPLITHTNFTHFISQFPHLLTLKNFQFQPTNDLFVNFTEYSYKLKTLNIINCQCWFFLSRNFPDICDFSIHSTYTLSSQFLNGIEMCRNLVHFRVQGMKERLWTCKIVESLFGLPCIKTLEMVDCNLKILNLNLYILESSVVEHVVVGKQSARSLLALLSNTNIRTLNVAGSLKGGLQTKNMLDLVLKQEIFHNGRFKYVAGVSLLFYGYDKLNCMDDFKGFLTRGKFDRLELVGDAKLPREVIECIPPLKTLDCGNEMIYPKRLATIVAEELILYNEGSVLKDFVPPIGCKKLKLFNGAVRGDELKRLLELGLDISFDGLDAAKMLGNIENYEKHYFTISRQEPENRIEEETDREGSENENQGDMFPYQDEDEEDEYESEF